MPQAQFAGFYVALAKGYYKAEGIDLTINPGGPNLLTENLVATGADTFGLSGGTDSVFAARDKGLPIVCIGVAASDHAIRLRHPQGRAGEDARRISRARPVTTWFTGANHVLNGMLAKEGIKPDEVKIQPQQVSVTPFVDGTVDVVTATYYNELYTIQSRMPKDSLKIFVAEDYGITFPRDTLIVSETTAKEKPDLVKALPARLDQRLEGCVRRSEGRRRCRDGRRPDARPRAAGIHAHRGEAPDDGRQGRRRMACSGSIPTRSRPPMTSS